MAELKDYSGPFKQDVKLQDFSKEFLVKLAKEWQAQYLKLTEICWNMVNEKWGPQVADEFEVELWRRLPKVNVPRIAKLANIDVKDAVDYQKVVQLLVEGWAFQPIITFEVINRDHVKATVHRCLMLEYYEKYDPSRIINVCHRVEVAIGNEYIRVLLPDFKANVLKLPPRKSPSEIACEWEFVRTS